MTSLLTKLLEITWLELHVVGELPVGERELGVQVLTEQGYGLDRLEDGGVHLLLECLLVVTGLLVIVVLDEETLVVLHRGRVDAGEGGVVKLRNIDLRHIDNGGGGESFN